MSDLLPILHPAMTLCSICPEPGRCCSGFFLYSGKDQTLTFWADSWREDADAYLRENGLPYQPLCREGSLWTAGFREYTAVRFSCAHLHGGRCGIYETRPDICRRFVPGTDPLCVFGVAA